MKSQIALLFGLALVAALVGSSPIAENKMEEASQIRQSAEFPEYKDRIIEEESLLRQSEEDSDDDDRIMKEGID